jgi:tRNA(Ile2)-agmatinylcytidine synthase
MIENSESKNNKANSGLVMLCKKKVPVDIVRFAEKCINREIKMEEMRKLVKNKDIEYFGQGNKRGLIGALASIGNTLEKDHTYELIAYRKNGNGERGVSLQSVIKIDKEKKYSLFSNIDYNSHRVLITPHGRDPILFALRGNNPEYLYKAMSELKLYEDVERFTIFRSNQGTNQHLNNKLDLSSLRTYDSGHIIGKMVDKPVVIRGGHVFIKIKNKKKIINCAVYAPTISLKNLARNLKAGDEIELGGGISRKSKKFGRILNVEYIKTIKLTDRSIKKNPLCKKCNKSMKSIGKNKGYRCIKCGSKSNKIRKIERKSEIENKLYLPVLSAQRHLIKPVDRYGKEQKNKKKLKGNWFKIFE